jgi:predicted RNA methylase
MKRKHLIWQLESLDTFEQPKLHLEQYATSAEMAAEILESIDAEEHLEGKKVADFGCGPGILLIGSALMGAEKCVGYEIDEEVAEICRRNIEEAEMSDKCSVQIKNVS